MSARAAEVAEGGTLQVVDKVVNKGSAKAGKSTTRFWLSTDDVKDAADPKLPKTRSVKALTPGTVAKGNGGLSIPDDVPVGEHYLIAAPTPRRRSPNRTRRTTAKLPRTPLSSLHPRPITTLSTRTSPRAGSTPRRRLPTRSSRTSTTIVCRLAIRATTLSHSRATRCLRSPSSGIRCRLIPNCYSSRI